MNRKPWTIRREMVAVAVVGMTLGLIASEQWRWGYPRHVTFTRENALAWMATVIHSDFRMYDGGDVQSLMTYVANSGLLIGRTREQLVDVLGPRDDWASPPPPSSDPTELNFSAGTVPRTMHVGPPVLTCRFGDDGKCVQVIPFASW